MESSCAVCKPLDLTLSSFTSPYMALTSLSSVVSSVKWEWRDLQHRILVLTTQAWKPMETHGFPWRPMEKNWHLGGLGECDFLLLPLSPFLDYSSMRVVEDSYLVKACSESHPLNIVFSGISNTNNLPLHTHFSFLDYFLKSHTCLIKKLILQ